MPFAYRRRKRKVVVDEADGNGAIADGGSHAFHRAVPDVADGEHARGSGLQQERRPLQGPVLTSIGSGEDESPLVAPDGVRQPASERLRADQHEYAGGWHPLGLAGVAVTEQQMLKAPAATAARLLAAVAHAHVRRG